MTSSPAPHRRHLDLVAAAGAAIDFLAGAELQILAHAEAHFAQARLVAGHRDRGGAQARIGLDEASSTSAGATVFVSDNSRYCSGIFTAERALRMVSK